MERVHSLLDHESSLVPPNKIIIAGFSHGGALALHAGYVGSATVMQGDRPSRLQYRARLAGVISVCGYAPLASRYESTATVLQGDTPILALHGNRDPVVSIEIPRCGFSLLL